MIRFMWTTVLTVGLTAPKLGAVPLPDGPGQLPLGVRYVPSDATAFFHVRFAQLWDHPLMKSVREAVGEENSILANANIVDQGIEPANVVSVTGFVAGRAADQDWTHDRWAVVVAAREPFDQEKVLKHYGTGKPSDDGLIPVVGSSSYLHFPDETTLVILSHTFTEEYLDGPRAEPSEFVRYAADPRNTLILRIRPIEFGLDAMDGILRELTDVWVAESIQFAIEAAEPITFRVLLNATNPDQAAQANKVIEQLIQLGILLMRAERDSVPPQDLDRAVRLLLLDLVLEVLESAQFEQQGQSVIGSAKLESNQELYDRIAQVGEEVRRNAPIMESVNNLKPLSLAIINYSDANRGEMPQKGAILDANGKPLLSWRVAILPYIEQTLLYQQFHLDEPWNSDHNIKLLDQMPQVFALPGEEGEAGKTHYRVFGGHGIFGGERLTFPASIPDGTSNTIMVIESEEAIEWTKPETLDYDPEKEFPKLLYRDDDRVNAGMADGSVRRLRKDLPAETWQRLIDPADGLVIPAEAFE